MLSGQPDPRYLTYAGGKQLDCGNQNTTTTAPINPVALQLLQAKRPDGSYLIPVPQTVLTSGANAGLGFSSYSLPSIYNENQFLFNADYILSPKHTLSERGYVATIDQFRTFGSPSGYPGTATLPGIGTPQALQARDYVASLNLTSSLTKNGRERSAYELHALAAECRGRGHPLGYFNRHDLGGSVFQSSARDDRVGCARKLPPLREHR